MIYFLQGHIGGKWNQGNFGTDLGKLVVAMEEMTNADPKIGPMRVCDKTGRIVAQNKFSVQPYGKVSETAPFWIVMSLDKPGPVERGDRPYARHDTEAKAKEQARLLSRACGGGRFVVLEATWATGWSETEIRTIDNGVPF